MLECKAFSEVSSFLTDDQLRIENYFQFRHPAPSLDPVVKHTSRWTLPGKTRTAGRIVCLTYPPRYRLLDRWKGLSRPCSCLSADVPDTVDSSLASPKVWRRQDSQSKRYRACSVPASSIDRCCPAYQRQASNVENSDLSAPDALAPEVLKRKLQHAVKRIRDQHNRLMALEQSVEDAPSSSLPESPSSFVGDAKALYAIRVRYK